MSRPIVTPNRIRRFGDVLLIREMSPRTAEKYSRDLGKLLDYTEGGAISRDVLIGFKEKLAESYKPASVNSMIAAVNSYLDHNGWSGLKLRTLRIQRNYDDDRELSREEYFRLVQTAEDAGDRRSSLVFQTICATGIRVSELRYITAEAVIRGKAVVHCKGKHRSVYLPDSLRIMLGHYLREADISEGSVFITKSGKPLDRSNIYKRMQTLGIRAGIPADKLFPHNLRHLFARTYYATHNDIVRLADILGHSDISTTRVYLRERGESFTQQLNRLALTLDKKNTT